MVVKVHERRKCERHAEGTGVKRLREWAGVYEGELVCSHHYVGSVATQTRGGLQVLTPSRGEMQGTELEFGGCGPDTEVPFRTCEMRKSRTVGRI